MPRLRKLRRKQKYQYNVNRRSLNQKSKRLPQINCDAVRLAWNDKKSVSDNLTGMGLVADPNKDISFGIPSGKNKVMPLNVNETENVGIKPIIAKKPVDSVSEFPLVVKTLEENAQKAYDEKVPHPLPNGLFNKLVKFMNKHGEDYEAMARDFENYDQQTPAQLHNLVKRLKSIPSQWIPYLRSRDFNMATIPKHPKKTMTSKIK